MKTIVTFFFFACTAALVAAPSPENKNKAPVPPPFDADLYRKDAQVISVRGDFLFWRVQEGALDYALTMNQAAWGPTQCYAQGKMKSATFYGEPGFRVAAGFFRAPKYWEFWTQYTRLTARGNNHTSKPGAATEFLTGTWPQIFTSPAVTTNATSHQHLNYNVADILADRVFFPNPHLRLRLIGGGSAAWINQFWKILYTASNGFETKISNRWKFVGGGLRAGIALDWYWFSNIYITGGSNLALLLGFYKNQAFQNANFNPSGLFDNTIPLRDMHFKDVRAVYTSQFFFGPSYQQNWTNQRMELFVGYEINAWWNLQEVYRSTAGAPSDAKETWINTGLLALQGLTARATLDF